MFKIILCALLLAATSTHAQVTSFHFIGTGSGNLGSGTGSQSFTIGELASGWYAGSDISLSSNVYQPLFLITSKDLEDIENHNNFFPNPTRGEVTFRFGVDAPLGRTIEIYTPASLLLTREQFSSPEFTLNISHYPDGVYLARISDRLTGKIRTIKIIKSIN